MIGNLSIKAKFVLTSAFAVATIIILGAAGFFGMVSSDNGLTQIVTVTKAVRDQMQADMMHDALRADVLNAMRIGPRGAAEDRDGIRSDIADHAQSFNDAIASLKGATLNRQATKAIAEVEPDLNAYVVSAKRLVDYALTSSQDNTVEFEKFMEAFEKLEGSMANLGDIVEKTSFAIAADVKGNNQKLLTLLGVVAAVMILSQVVASVAGARAITGPIGAISQAMLRLANGDVQVDIPGRDRRDEIRAMADAVQVFKDNKIKADELQNARLAEEQAKTARVEKISKLTTNFDGIVRKALLSVSSTGQQLRSSAQIMEKSAAETDVQTHSAVSAAELASSNVQTVAAAAEELTASIREITDRVAESARMTKHVVSESLRAKTTMSELSEASKCITQIVAIITDVADQTKLLALNATIEAARAGETGRGFAVVADQVKQLANQTSSATDQISKQIQSVQNATRSSIEVLENIFASISKVEQASASIATAVDMQNEATKEIARNVEQAAGGTRQVTDNINSVGKTATQTKQASHDALVAAQDLNAQAENLRAEVDGFLDTIAHAA